MKQNLGKSIILLLLLNFVTSTYAARVETIVDTAVVHEGESVSFTISATGGDAEFPDISDVDGYVIQGVSSSSSTSIINGDVFKKIAKTYRFTPAKDVTIPAFTVKVDGKKHTTQAKKIIVTKPVKSKVGDDFIVELKVDKQKLKVGQSTKLRVLFKQKLDSYADKLALNEPKLENFWVKKVAIGANNKTSKQYNQGHYRVSEFEYLIFAQKAGEFHIPPIVADIGKVVQRQRGRSAFSDPFFNSLTAKMKWRKVYSNELDIHVDALPDNLELYGDFYINAVVDKNEVYANKPTNLTITVQGVGNIDDIRKFELSSHHEMSSDLILYTDEPNVESDLNNQGEYGGTFRQKVALISDKNFTIPSLTLRFFDKETEKVKIIQTDSITVKVKNSVPSTPQPIVEQVVKKQKKEDIAVDTKAMLQPEKDSGEPANKYLTYQFLLAGILIGVTFSYLLMRKSPAPVTKDVDIVKSIKKAKSDRKLFELLLPYAKEYTVVSEILKLLEENIYYKANHKIDKQKLYDLFLV